MAKEITQSPAKGQVVRKWTNDVTPLNADEALGLLEKSWGLLITLDKQKQLNDWACTGNHYVVTDKEKDNSVLFFIQEDSNCCCYCFCGPARATTFIVLSPNYEDIATFVRRACRFLGKVLLFIKKLTNNKYLLLFINNIFFL
ncbi:hypothetical protein EB796_002029 [Bugula neritina]|uniref:Uncharacterized protein n=1 Tax=Bugula neritina TaxID=10212 RepID=A0A7J7KNA3_BUGNE|nr:hypothetical protein EB796_002029 [Bugula neritina]